MAIDAVLARLDVKRRTCKGGAVARCPAHEDRVASLSVDPGPDGRVLIRCFGGCPTDAVVAALGLDMADLFEPDHELPTFARARTTAPRTTTYELRDAAGELVAVHKRTDRASGKSFSWHASIPNTMNTCGPARVKGQNACANAGE
jgi:hypothetical protein